MDQGGRSGEGAAGRNDIPSLWIDSITQRSQRKQAETFRGRCLFRCADGFAFAKAGERRDRARCALECVTAKAASQRYDSTGLFRCCARFFENQRDRATEGEEITIYRCDPKKVEALLSVSCGA